MKGLLCFGFLLVSYLGVGQVVDTVSIQKELDSLLNICHELTGNGQFDLALGTIEKVEEKYLRVFGEESMFYAKCLGIHGIVFYDWGEYSKAEFIFLKMKPIVEKVFGSVHSNYAYCLLNLANIYQVNSDYEKAEIFFLEAKSILEKTLGRNHSGYAMVVYNLANLYRKKGIYDKSELLHLEAKEIWSKVVGKNNSNYARSLNNLANVFVEKGDYIEAEKLLLEAKGIKENLLGKKNSDYANTLISLAKLYQVKGDYNKAELFYLEAIDIKESIFGKYHREYANRLNDLGVLYSIRGNLDMAKKMHTEAKEIREKIVGALHPDYGQSLSNLANVYYYLKEYNKSESLQLEAKEILGKSLGRAHPDYAQVLNCLGGLYLAEEKYEKVEPLYLEVKKIREKVFGQEHLDYISILDNLVMLYKCEGDQAKTEYYSIFSNSLSKLLINKLGTYSSEKEILQFRSLFEERFDALFSYTQLFPVDDLLKVVYDNALFLKNPIIDAAIAREKIIGRTDSITRETYSKYKSCHYQLIKWYEKPLEFRDSAIIASLQEKADQCEKEIVKRTASFFGETIQQTKWHAVRAALQPDQAAIEIIHYRYYDKKVTDSIMYAALLLLPNDTTPHFIPLCEERQLDALIYKPNGTRANYLQNLYSSPRTDGLASLYQLVWASIDKVLKDNGVKTVYYAPSGLLHRLNLAAIAPDKSGQTLGDLYHLIPVASTRQLVTDHSEASTPTSAIIYGGVRYEMDSTAIARANRDLSATAQDTTGGLFRYANRGAERADNWDTLAGTRREALYLYQLLSKQGIGATLRMNYEATEESFKQIGQQSPSPSLLHVGTHGFFFPDPKDTTRRRTNFGDDAPVFKISEHPLIRSGLKLAGSKYAWENKRPMGGMEDGILTAYEVSQMNLSNTQLVVLSACETGLGDIKGNEGVYGLQRAFRIAGAKNVLMSLWKVPDEATEKLMTRFYKNWLEQKMPLRLAFESAQKWLRGQKGYENPYFWAGFVLIGEL